MSGDGWYVVITKPRQEARAATQLQNQGGEVYLPMLEVERISRGKRELRPEPLFPGYLFFRTGGQDVLLSKVRSTLGVRMLLTFGNEPVQMDNSIVDDIRSRMQQHEFVTALQPGDQVSLADGPFRDYQAIFQEYSGEERAVILVRLLGQQNRLVVQLSQLRQM